MEAGPALDALIAVLQGLRDDLQGVGPDGSAWSGSEGSRLAPINQEIQLISSGQRGLSQPCQVIMIDATY